jgi:hypothetical protein
MLSVGQKSLPQKEFREEEAVEGVGGGGVERVSVLPSNLFIAGSVFR